MLVNMGTMFAMVPLAFVLSRFTPLDEMGVAWAMAGVLIIRPLAYIPYYLSGRYLKIRLFAHEKLADS